MAFGVVFFFLLLMFAGLASSAQQRPTVKAGSVLVVSMSGLIPEEVPENPFQLLVRGPEINTLHEITGSIRRAANDERISALWLKPRGVANGWASLEEIKAAVDVFRASGKPILASSGASGYTEKDYFVAVSADRIVSPKMARFELNGLALIIQFVKQLLDKLDIEVEAVRAGNFKSATEPFLRDHASDENLEQLQAVLDAHSELFMAEIADRRAIERETLRGLIDGGDVTGSERALELGLLDSLMTVEEVDKLLKQITGEEDRLNTVSVGNYAQASRGGGPNGTVAVVKAVGTIVPGRSSRDRNPVFGGANVGSESLAKTLKRLQEDDSIDAVVLRINSPGGSAAASDVIWQAVKQTGEAKPVVASLSDIAASGGYYIAAGADTIIAERTTLTGSIGVFSLLLDLSGLMEDKLGVTHDVLKSGPYADMFSGLRTLTEHERSILRDDVDRTYERFKGLVSEGRKMTRAEVEAAAQGRIWAGVDALRLGLIDTLGGLQEAIQIAAASANLEEGEYTVRTYPGPRGFLERLSEWVGTTAPEVLSRFSIWRVQQWLTMHGRILQAASDLQGSPQAMFPMTVTVR